jgi:predicted acylesterase/phospholipase RssA
MATTATDTTEIGLVLQGGGALGAYEYGAVTSLLELIDAAVAKGHNVTLKAVTGVSIGAINAACVVGSATRLDARRRLAALWNDFAVSTPFFWPARIARDLSLYGLPHFYAMRPDLLALSSWTYVYDTHPLLTTLSEHVDFAALNRSETAFVVTAVDVEKGELKRFSNRPVGKTTPTTIGPRHVLASGSLPPQFPWTDIEEGSELRPYWDGGLVDNTPLGDAIDAFSPGENVDRVLVIMNLFPSEAVRPSSLLEVNERINQLRFGNRTQQDKKTAGRINELVATIDSLAALLPGELPPEVAEQVEAARRYKYVSTVEISLPPNEAQDHYGFRDFSSEGIERRRAAGRTRALDALRSTFAPML